MLIYLLQVIACSGLLYGYYHWFLRNGRFHQYNRYYLLLAVIVSLLLPLLKIPVLVSAENKVLHSFKPLYTINAEVTYTPITILKTYNLNISDLIFIITVIVAVILMLRLFVAIVKIVKIKAAAKVTAERECKFIVTEHESAPFSFFKWLFWNKKMDIQTTAGQQVFRHELYHIKMKHSYDTLLQEILLCIFWINPFFYLYRKELKVIHEFLADKYASEGYNAYDYARLLVFQSACGANSPLVHTFFNSQLKRRIVMLTTSKKPAYRYLRKIMVLPLLAIAIGLFAFTYKTPVKKAVAAIQKISDYPVINMPLIVKKDIKPAHVAKAIQENKLRNVQPDLQKTGCTVHDTTYYLDGEKITKEKYDELSNYKSLKLYVIFTANGNVGRYLSTKKPTLYPIQNQSQLKEVVVMGVRNDDDSVQVDDKVVRAADEPPVFMEGNWVKYLEKNINGMVAANKKAPKNSYTTDVTFIIEKDGSIKDIKVLTNYGYGIEEEAKRVIENTSGKWKPAVQEGKNVRFVLTQPVTFIVH